MDNKSGSGKSDLVPILQKDTLPALSPIATIDVISPFHLYSFGLNLQQLIEVQCPMNMFLVLKSFVLDKFIAKFILLSSKDGHTKLLKSGDHAGILTYFMGFIFSPYGESFIDLYF